MHWHADVRSAHSNRWQEAGCKSSTALQEHYEKLKAARDSAEHLCDETARQLARTEKQLSEAQHAIESSIHEVWHDVATCCTGKIVTLGTSCFSIINKYINQWCSAYICTALFTAPFS